MRVLAACALLLWMAVGQGRVSATPGRGGGVAGPGGLGSSSGDQVCASCHQAIYASYERTSMAQGSGPVSVAGLAQGEFTHAASGVEYRVFVRDGRAWFSYDRAAKSAPAIQMFDLDHPAGAGGGTSPGAGVGAGALHGERPLEYFVGSGKHGRTYLYQVDGTWFELPINYYTRRLSWGMAPAFDRAATMPADLPVDPSCLHCHATGIATAEAGSRSHYAGAPFAEGGVGCSACHGDPSEHLAAHGHGAIVNPAKLDQGRRESVCLACHLEGDAVVFKPGESAAGFRAGDDLAGMAVFFVRASAAGGGGRAASQYEALLRSACKRGAGDRLTCTSCHDPHSSPAESERVAYYRGKCLACHTGAAMANEHHPEQQDCAVCHMPTRATSDISHEQSVDHDIERAPSPAAGVARTGDALVAVGGWKYSDRELGMAYAQMAGRGDREAGERALTLLARAEAAGADDALMHAQLGFLRQMSGDRERARAEYLAALARDPHEATSLGNLAVLDATGGRVGEAVELLGRLIAADPTQTAAGLNLAFIECRLGEVAKARGVLDVVAKYNPDDAALRALVASGNYHGQHCELGPTGAERAR